VIYFRLDSEIASRSRLWVSAVSGGAPERLTDEEIEESPGSWSPDGAWYLYYTREGDARTLKRVKTTGGATPETLLDGGFTLSPIWSPDGRWVLAPGHTMTLLSMEDKKPRDVGTGSSPCAFAATGQLLYCIRKTTGFDPDLVTVDFNGEIVRTIGRVPLADTPTARFGPGVQLSPTPDRRGVTYSVYRPSKGLWVLEGLDKIELP
jgi:hypothetical protein